MKKINQITASAFALSLFLTLSNCKTVAQSSNSTPNVPGSISIDMSATELIPADIIVFNININASAKTPQDAFDEHKKRESVLAGLLKEFDIEESEINFQPVRINKTTNYNNNRREEAVQTNQQVSVSFSDFSIYEKIQLTLIENGFDSFNGRFSSSKMEEGKIKALDMAIQKAKERAEFIAEKSGVKLRSITKISYSDHQVTRPPVVMEDAAMMRASSESSMMDFAQTVSVTANISIEFFITSE